MQSLEIKTFRYLQTLVLLLFDFVPRYAFPIHFTKIDMTTKILEVSSDSPLPLPLIPWLRGFTWYAWSYNDIFDIPQVLSSTIVFSGKLPTSTRVVQESNLNQIDGWVSILWEHLNCIQQQKRTRSGTWVSKKRYPGQRHVPCTKVCWVPPLGKMSS